MASVSLNTSPQPPQNRVQQLVRTQSLKSEVQSVTPPAQDTGAVRDRGAVQYTASVRTTGAESKLYTPSQPRQSSARLMAENGTGSIIKETPLEREDRIEAEQEEREEKLEASRKEWHEKLEAERREREERLEAERKEKLQAAREEERIEELEALEQEFRTDLYELLEDERAANDLTALRNTLVARVDLFA